MADFSSDPRWVQFRRLILGTVVDCLREANIDVDVPSIKVSFDDASKFQVPRLDNYMRFKGVFEANVSTAVAPASLDVFRRGVSGAWAALVKTIDIPIGDKLTPDRSDLSISTEGQSLRIQFDLEADLACLVLQPRCGHRVRASALKARHGRADQGLQDPLPNPGK